MCKNQRDMQNLNDKEWIFVQYYNQVSLLYSVRYFAVHKSCHRDFHFFRRVCLEFKFQYLSLLRGNLSKSSCCITIQNGNEFTV